MMRGIYGAIIALFMLSVPAFSQAIKQDGNWWNMLTRGERIVYVAGFVDGTHATYNRADAVAQVSVLEASPPCKAKDCSDSIKMNYAHGIHGAWSKSESRYNGITIGQIVDGLTTLFSDYRNRAIRLRDAEDAVIDSIKGASDDSTRDHLEYLRKHASEN